MISKQMKDAEPIPRRIFAPDVQASFDVMVWDARRRLRLLVKKDGGHWN